MSDPGTEPLSEWNVVVGIIGGAHGVRGEVWVRSESETPERFAPGSRLCLVREPGPRRVVTVVGSRTHKGRLLVQFSDYGDRDRAETLRGASLTIAESMRPALAAGAYYHSDLLGLSVTTTTGQPLGEVQAVLECPGNDVLQTSTALIPVIRECILEVDLDRGQLTVDERFVVVD